MKIGHVHLKVRNLERAERFYTFVLGASATERVAGCFSFLSMGESHHEIALQELGEFAKQPARDAVGLYHSAFEVSDLDELLSAVKRLDELGAAYSIVDHGISRAVYSSDPDGNGVEIYLDSRKSASGSRLWNGRSRALSIEDLKRNR